MLQQIVLDLREFIVVFFIFLITFTQIFFYRLSPWDRARFGFHDDDAPNVFHSFKASLQAVYLLAFTGDFDFDNYRRDVEIRAEINPKTNLESEL